MADAPFGNMHLVVNYKRTTFVGWYVSNRSTCKVYSAFPRGMYGRILTTMYFSSEIMLLPQDRSGNRTSLCRSSLFMQRHQPSTLSSTGRALQPNAPLTWSLCSRSSSCTASRPDQQYAKVHALFAAQDHRLPKGISPVVPRKRSGNCYDSSRLACHHLFGPFDFHFYIGKQLRMDGRLGEHILDDDCMFVVEQDSVVSIGVNCVYSQAIPPVEGHFWLCLIRIRVLAGFLRINRFLGHQFCD
ncbi:hypothetical protein KCU90_g181, partial [Aureobasidium melanogenum]